jgi:hypothetical protein
VVVSLATTRLELFAESTLVVLFIFVVNSRVIVKKTTSEFALRFAR